MEIALVAVGFVAVVALIVASVALIRAPGPSLVGKTVVIVTRKPDDRTIRGVLHGKYPDRWTLRNATILLPGGREQALDGLEHVPVSSVSFVQEIEAKA